MKSWTWQKWVGKLAPLVVALLTEGVWTFIEAPAPAWAPIIAGIVTMIAQAIISLFPVKAA